MEFLFFNFVGVTDIEFSSNHKPATFYLFFFEFYIYHYNNTEILKLKFSIIIASLMQFQEGHCNYGIIYDNYIKLEL